MICAACQLSEEELQTLQGRDMKLAEKKKDIATSLPCLMNSEQYISIYCRFVLLSIWVIQCYKENSCSTPLIFYTLEIDRYHAFWFKAPQFPLLYACNICIFGEVVSRFLSGLYLILSGIGKVDHRITGGKDLKIILFHWEMFPVDMIHQTWCCIF